MLLFLNFLITHVASKGQTSNSTVLFAVVSVFSLCVLVVVGCCSCRKKRNEKGSDKDSDNAEKGPERQELRANLIPPLFFTQGLKDPLQQDDLLEKVKQEGVSI